MKLYFFIAAQIAQLAQPILNSIGLGNFGNLGSNSEIQPKTKRYFIINSRTISGTL